MLGTSRKRRGSAGLPYAPTCWVFSPENSIYGGLVPVAKWRLIIFRPDYRKTPNNEGWSPISVCFCPLRDTLTGLGERHTLGTSSWKAARGHWRANPRKSWVIGNFCTS